MSYELIFLVTVMQYTGLKSSLPPNVHLLTVKLLEESSYFSLLVRLEHQFEAHEAPFNETATVSMAVSELCSYNSIHIHA